MLIITSGIEITTTINNNIETAPTSPGVNRSNPFPQTLYQSLEVCDFHVLDIHMKNGLTVKQRFDYACRAVDYKHNFQLLMTEFNTGLEQLEVSVCKVHLMYTKSDEYKEQDQSDTPNAGDGNRPGRARVSFQSTLELLNRLARSAITISRGRYIFSSRTAQRMRSKYSMSSFRCSICTLPRLDECSRTRFFSYVLAPKQRNKQFQHTLMQADAL